MPPPDSIGHTRVIFQGKEIWNHFNRKKGCLQRFSSYVHICLKCKKPSHGQSACHPSIATGTEHSITTGSRNRLKVSNGAKIRNRYNQVPHLTQDTNGKVTNSQKTPQTRAKRSALSQQVTTKHI